MKTIRTINVTITGAMVAVALMASACESGLLSNDKSVSEVALQGHQQIDEQALGVVYAAATLANLSITAAAPSMTVDQAKQAFAIKAKYTAAVKIAERAKATGDAKTYTAKIREATGLFNQVSSLIVAAKEK